MNPEARNLEEAKAWFAANSSGELTCFKEDGTQKTCSSFEEAQAFYGAEKTEETAAPAE